MAMSEPTGCACDCVCGHAVVRHGCKGDCQGRCPAPCLVAECRCNGFAPAPRPYIVVESFAEPIVGDPLLDVTRKLVGFARACDFECGGVCALPAGHDGEHEYTPIGDITVRFL